MHGWDDTSRMEFVYRALLCASTGNGNLEICWYLFGFTNMMSKVNHLYSTGIVLCASYRDPLHNLTSFINRPPRTACESNTDRDLYLSGASFSRLHIHSTYRCTVVRSYQAASAALIPNHRHPTGEKQVISLHIQIWFLLHTHSTPPPTFTCLSIPRIYRMRECDRVCSDQMYR
jgi:hypothetical protein